MSDKSNSKLRFAMISAAIVLTVVVFVDGRLWPSGNHNYASGIPAEPDQSRVAAGAENSRLEGKASGETEDTEASAEISTVPADWKSELRQRFGKTITHGHTQTKAVEKLLAYLKHEYPDSWRRELERHLREVFPEYAAQMLQLFESMEAYNTWLESEKHNLMQMDAEQRRKLLWDMRYSYFGDQAKEIWQAALKNDEFARSLEQLDANSALTLEQKVSDYARLLDRVYAHSDAQIKSRRSQEFSDRFLSLDSVQSSLSEMEPSERYDALRQVRAQLGMDEAAQNRWYELDKKRDERWQTGQQYMQARENLLAHGDDPAALRDLQLDYFGPEAEIIANEEASGYFRFEEARVYGRN